MILKSNLLVLTSLVACLTLLPGCNSASNEGSPDASTNQKVRKISVNVLVLDDDLLGPVIKRQFGSRQSGEINLTEMSWKEFADSGYSAAGNNDVLIYPSRRIGELAERRLLAPITEDNMRMEEGGTRSILSFDRDLATSWGKDKIAMSLGQSHWVALYRQDVLEKLKYEVPETWKEFHQLAKTLLDSDSASSLPRRVAVPLTGHWASHALVLRTASAIRVPGKYSSYFDVKSMEPLIDREPFLRSLQDWQSEIGNTQVVPQSPVEILADYANGNVAIAIVPLNRHWLDATGVETLPPTIMGGIPGWSAIFDHSREIWTSQLDGTLLSVPFTGATGMLASASSATQQERNSMEFIAWLTSKKISSVVATESPNTGLSRKSHLGNPSKWTGPLISGENASRFADFLTRLNSGRRAMTVLRIPQSDRYLDVLDEAVRSVIVDKANAVEQLATATMAWSGITGEIGQDQQLKAYRSSEGLKK